MPTAARKRKARPPFPDPAFVRAVRKMGLVVRGDSEAGIYVVTRGRAWLGSFVPQTASVYVAGRGLFSLSGAAAAGCFGG